MDVSRYTDVTELNFEIEFITPTFLGGADGNAEIRTAPFKNLLRRWWRIANGHLSHEELWKKEAELFGSTEKNPDIVEANKKRKSYEKEPEIFGKSKVALKIDNAASSVQYSQIADKEKLSKKFLYLGYGPVQNNKDETRKFIKEESKIAMTLTIPKEDKETFICVLSIINLFGCVGARSHKGFGSIAVQNLKNEDKDEKLWNLKKLEESDFFKNEDKIFIKKYPHCLGKDDKGKICWNTEQKESLDAIMEDLETVYRYIKKSLKNHLKDEGMISIDKWIKDRKPYPLLFKVNKSGKNYQGRILPIPYSLSNSNREKKIFKFIIDEFDNEQGIKFDNEVIKLKRFGGAAKK